MSRFFGFIALLMVVAAGAGIYVRQAKTVSAGGNPSANVDIVGVKHDLMTIAQAERTHNALRGGYASLDDLRSSGDLSMARNNRGFYNYSTEVTDSGFRVTAIYSGPENPLAPKSLSIDQSMGIIQE
ncbi:MAG: hypothetical protein DMG65_25995 [Candidatus Angelobacter sp. Gp1-AA117]|nr:MAG: hypothetical protein DMG65_25995 [Candidatus Angelobacter sp. Gp1-AA117]